MHAFEIVLKTARLTLRPLVEDDIASLFAIHSKPETMRYWSTPVWQDDQPGRMMVQRDLESNATDYVRFGIEQTLSQTLIGVCTLFDFNSQCRRAQLGYILDLSAWGHGYMQEALTALIDYGFRQLKLHRIEADTDPRNVRSMQLLERLHFVKEGHLRERWIVDGEVSDSAMFGLLHSDWLRKS